MPRPRPRRRHDSGRVVAVLLVMLMLAASLQQMALAQADGDPPADATETPSDPTAEPETVPTEIPPQPTEAPIEATAPPVATDSPAPTAQSPPASTTAPAPVFTDIINYVRICPAGFQPKTIGWSAFLDACPDPGAGFTLSASGRGFPGQAGISDARGMVIFRSVPAGTVRLGQEPRSGYGEPYVFCAVAGAPQPVATPGNAFDYALPAPPAGTSTGASGAACFWFNTPLQVGDPGTPEDNPVDGPTDAELEVFKRYCPEGYDPAGATLDVLLADCDEAGANVTFSLTGGAYGQKATTDAAGSATFTGIPAGTAELTEVTGGDDEVVVACAPAASGLRMARTVPIQGPVDGSFELKIPLDLLIDPNGPEYTCYVFNIPLPSSGLTIYKYVCAPDVTIDSGTDLEEALERCPDHLLDIAFAVTADNYEAVAPSEANGVIFDDVPTGAATISEVMPPGYGEPVVYCQWSAEVDGAAIEALPAQLAPEAGALEIDIPFPGTAYICSWFNIPLPDGPSTVTFVKHLCPEGTDPATATLESLLADCVEPGVDVGFAFAADGYEHILQTDEDGTVTFSEVPFGRITVEEDPVDGYRDSIVYCGWTAPVSGGGEVVASPVQVPTYGFNLDLEIPAPGSEVTCDWFNLAEADSVLASFTSGTTGDPGTGRIDLTAHACPGDLDRTASQADLAAACAPMAGVRYDLTSFDFFVTGASQETDANGLVSWDEVPNGSWRVFQTPVPGHGPGMAAWCRYLDDPNNPFGDDGPWFQPAQATINAFDGEFAAGDVHLACDAYVFALDPGTPDPTTPAETPEPTPQPGQIDMHVAICPAGYTFESFDITDLGDCLPGETGVTFTATDGGSYAESPPGSDGSWRVFFDNVPLDATVTITRDVASGEGAPFATCDQGNGVLNVVPADNGIQTTVESVTAGAPFERCLWFTVPSDEPAGVTVDTHTCPANAPDPDAATYEDYLASCAEPGAGITFHVYDTNVAGPVLYDQTDATGHLAWEGAAGERFSVLEEVPEGYGEPVVYCAYGSAAVPDPTWERQPIEPGNHITSAFPLAPGYTWACHWFNIPATGAEPPPDADATAEPPVAPTGPDATVRPADVPTEVHTEVPAVTEVPTGQPTDTPATEVPSTEPDPSEEPEGSEIPATETPADVPHAGVTLTVAKYACPDGFAAWDASLDELAATCAAPQAGVEFGLSHAAGAEPGVTDANGEIAWEAVPAGFAGLQEYLPDGYAEPVIACGSDGDLARMDGPSAWVGFALVEGTTFHCNVYNVPGGAATLVANLFTCPAGFDLHAYGSDPRADCTDAAEGITFTLEGADGGSREAMTVDGVARFDGLEPGGYTLTETVPAGISSIFVLDCDGQHMNELRPYPLVTGDTLGLHLRAGETVSCVWFNVEDEPLGRLTVIAYDCTTISFVSEIECQVAEGGRAFDLAWWNGDAWQTGATGTTDGAGRHTWAGLDTGAYWLDDRGSAWCHLSSERLSANGTWLDVVAGEETVVSIYACGVGEPGAPGKTPLKYPNTGVPPVDAPRRLDRP